MFNSDIKYDIPEANLQVKETKCLGLSSSPPPPPHAFSIYSKDWIQIILPLYPTIWNLE